MGSPTLGNQTAATLGFIAMVMFLGPIVSLIAPHSLVQSYLGANGIINSTYSSYSNNFQTPILQTANSTTGFFAQLSSAAFSPLAFIYGGIGLFWKSLTNMPTLLYIILTSSTSNVVFLPVAFASIFVVIMFSYITIGNFYKLLSMYMKSDAENVGQ